LNESLRAERGSWTAPAEDRSRKESGGSDFEVVSDQDDNRLEQDSIEEIPTDNYASSNNQKPDHGQSYRDTARSDRNDRNDCTDDEYRAPAGSFGHYISKQEEQGITLPRKSGRYDDQPDDRESSNAAPGNASGSWMTGGPPVKISTPPPTTSHLAPATFSHTSRNSFVLVAHPRGMRTQHVQCTIVRDRTSMQGKLYPTYELILEEPRKTLIVAQKMSLNRTSNYHLFDMTRGQAGSKLSKKSGNYLGKLRAKNVNRTGYALVNSKSDREEIGGVLFERVTMIDQIKDGNQPRRMTVLIPPTDDDGLSIPVPLNSLGVESLTDLLQAIEENKRVIPDHFCLMHTKDPVFENGNYRLNFHGRVSMPSVKNFQMVSDDDIEDIKCQFGKVDKDIFHLDYKAPFNALQAFALALCQFNL
jgi:tubby-related protein 1